MDEEPDEEDNRTAHNEGKDGIQAYEGIKGIGGKGPKHNKFTMRDVQHPGHAILKAKPHSDQGIKASHHETSDEDIQKEC